ncbi:PP2C family protein-serine/threonine phosphatase [Actinocrinis sp.]|uniref:PP2C family protein-serine/threonine phosphatase n=1 Tax=Actinocrinis sp. TaxID=1920516 RepID=UPI002C14DC6A|nr:SpoIIE family protein phosphatase [Actinocrinis sp.]HXR71976.1 SpoIIE family protein phosphatase [Actinocrinis sp.]
MFAIFQRLHARDTYPGNGRFALSDEQAAEAESPDTRTREEREGIPLLEPEVYRILLVEDDSGDALVVRELLAETQLAYTLRWSKTLGDAMAELRRAPFDCILLDLNLPDAVGAAVVSTLQLAATTSGIIVLTDLAESQAGALAVAYGAQDYLAKGQVDAQLLRRALRYSVHRKRAELAAAELRETRVRAQENARLERGLLPAPLLSSRVITATSRYLPGRQRALLGGDFLDVVQTSDGTVHAVIGDVSGHGPDEAALGVCLRIAWRALVLAGHRGIELLEYLEQITLAERPRDDFFATCTVVSMDPVGRVASIVLAGHHEPLLLGPGPPQLVPARYGVALGLGSGQCRWTETRLDLPDTGALLLYTDGLSEGHCGAGAQRLGVEGLLELIAAAPDANAEALLDHLVRTAQGLDSGRHSDDVAILLLDFSRRD